MSPEPACDCPPSFRRSDCRAGRESCRAFAPDAVPLFNSTRPVWIAGRWVFAAGIAGGLAVFALAFSGCGHGQCRDARGRFAACPSREAARAWEDFGRKASAQADAAKDRAARTERNRFEAASFRAAKDAAERRDQDACIRSGSDSRGACAAEALAVCADQCEAVDARVDARGVFYCRDAFGNEWPSGGECD